MGVTYETRVEVIARDGLACRYCGALLLADVVPIISTRSITLDHVVPLSAWRKLPDGAGFDPNPDTNPPVVNGVHRSQRHAARNLVVACHACNQAKAADPKAWPLYPPRFFDHAVLRALQLHAVLLDWSPARLADARDKAMGRRSLYASGAPGRPRPVRVRAERPEPPRTQPDREQRTQTAAERAAVARAAAFTRRTQLDRDPEERALTRPARKHKGPPPVEPWRPGSIIPQHRDL